MKDPKTWIELVALTIVIWYTYDTGSTLDEITKQTPEIAKSAKAAKVTADLTRQQLVSSEAAVLQISFQANFEPMPAPQYGLISRIDCLFGSADASDIHGSFDVSWEKLPEFEDVGKPQHIDFDIPKFSKIRVDKAQKALPLKGLTPETWEMIRRGKTNQTFKIKGSWRYSDGFEAIPEEQICRIWYSHFVMRGNTEPLFTPPLWIVRRTKAG